MFSQESIAAWVKANLGDQTSVVLEFVDALDEGRVEDHGVTSAIGAVLSTSGVGSVEIQPVRAG